MIVGLFLLPALYSPQNLSLSDYGFISPAEQNIIEDFVLSGDGDESPDSIPDFSETLDDDVLHYQDSDGMLDQDANLSDSYYYSSCSEAGSWVAGYSGAWNGGVTSSDSILTLNHTGGADNIGDAENSHLSISTVTANAYKVYTNFSYSANGTVGNLHLTISGTPVTILYIDTYSQSTWHAVNQTLTACTTLTTLNYHVELSTGVSLELMVDYIAIVPDTCYYESASTHYAESFAGIDDWTTSDTSITSDGDLANITENGAGSTGRAYASFDSTDFFEYYYEFSISTMTATTANLEFWDGSAYNTLRTFTAAGTYKGIISDSDAETMQRIGFLVGSEGGNLKPDYLRISKSNDTGWQHDGSTTQGISQVGGGTFSSDDDYISLTADADGSRFDFFIDSTATTANLDPDYYPFVKMRFHADDVGVGDILKLEYYTSGVGYVELQAQEVITSQTMRWNLRAGTSNDIQKLRVWVYISQTIRVDFLGAYSIANYTVTQQSGIGTDEYFYCDSGVLNVVKDSTYYILMSHNPLLSVDTATYSVWNITTDDIDPMGDAGYSILFQAYVGGNEYHYDASRGTWEGSGTFADFSLRLYTNVDMTISAITFIEDGTAPDADIAFSPDPLYDDEQVTLSSIVFDDVEVYKVWYNAITYPAGFDDIDYAATEGQENYWAYSFTSLTAGDYCFKVIANDGANNSTITQSNRDYATVRFTVREAEITVETYTLFGAGSDFTYMQYSGHISHDCAFIIEEWSDTWAINETHSGSVTAGDFNIAWDKIGVNDINANYTITFTNGSLTKVITSGYMTAYKLLRIADIDCNNLESSDSWKTNITINFYTNKAVDWYIYDVDDNDAALGSGFSLEGTDIITWVQNTARGAHYFAVKWTDGVSSEWFNSSYWIYDRNIDELPGGGDLDDGGDERRTIQMWATIGAVIGFVGILCLGLVYFKIDDMKNLQLPHYNTQPSTREERRRDAINRGG